MKLSYQQEKFINYLLDDFRFTIGCNSRGYTIKSVVNFNCTLYLTMTFRSLLNKGLVSVSENRVILTNKARELYDPCW